MLFVNNYICHIKVSLIWYCVQMLGPCLTNYLFWSVVGVDDVCRITLLFFHFFLHNYDNLLRPYLICLGGNGIFSSEPPHGLCHWLKKHLSHFWWVFKMSLISNKCKLLSLNSFLLPSLQTSVSQLRGKIPNCGRRIKKTCGHERWGLLLPSGFWVYK